MSDHDHQQVADQMWYFPLLRPWVDHVPIAADLSDLAEKIKWCREHDDECRQIAQRAMQVKSLPARPSVRASVRPSVPYT